MTVVTRKRYYSSESQKMRLDSTAILAGAEYCMMTQNNSAHREGADSCLCDDTAFSFLFFSFLFFSFLFFSFLFFSFLFFSFLFFSFLFFSPLYSILLM